MKTTLIAAAVAVIAALDVGFSGFRASCGRTGLVRHRRGDVVGCVRGLTVGAALLALPVAAVLVDGALGTGRAAVYRTAGGAMLAVYVPYGVVVLLSLAAYVTLTWRLRFLASAMLLGPLTLVRPIVALGGALAACWAEPDALVIGVAVTSVAAVLIVEPLVGRMWYSTPRPVLVIVPLASAAKPRTDAPVLQPSSARRAGRP